MLKYHKDIGFSNERISEAKELIQALNNMKIGFSIHALQELNKEAEAVYIGQALRDYRLNFNDVFEIAIDNNIIKKLGFRVKFSHNDIVFIISRSKIIITLWTNKKDDLHFTLNKSNYAEV
jgi:hypothetical protein